MPQRQAKYYFNSDKNQLPYEGNPATYCVWDAGPDLSTTGVGDFITIEQDELFDDDGVPVKSKSFAFHWEPLGSRYSPVFVKYRVRDQTFGTQSDWCIPQTLYTAVRYAIYKRRVATTPQPWALVEVTKTPNAGPYHENWAGRVQYAIGIWHVDGLPESSDGATSATDFSNRYILYATDPNSAYMDTKPFVM